jgi:hypothetical protein
VWAVSDADARNGVAEQPVGWAVEVDVEADAGSEAVRAVEGRPVVLGERLAEALALVRARAPPHDTLSTDTVSGLKGHETIPEEGLEPPTRGL